MLVISILLFIAAALFGAYILLAVLSNKPTPKKAVFTHGPLAATALIIMIIYATMGHTEPLLISSIVLFIIAALGGLTMFTIDMMQKPIPKSIAIIHPLVAVVALVMLIMYVAQ